MNHTAQDYEVRIWYSPEPGDECYIAQVIDMPAVTAHGETREEAAREIQAALDLTLSTYADDGEKPPVPRNAAAAALGRLGGRATSWKKKVAARINGKHGGRPRKKTAV
jgi:predicted RNase H-like HicB family nuclease